MSAVWNNSPVFTCVFSPVWHNHVSCLEQLTSVYVCFFSSIWHNHVGRLEQLASVNLRFFFSISGDWYFMSTIWLTHMPFTCVFFRIPGGRQVGMVCELQSRRIKSRRTSRAWPSWPFPDNCEQAWFTTLICLKGALVRSLKLSAPWDVETRGIYLTHGLTIRFAGKVLLKIGLSHDLDFLSTSTLASEPTKFWTIPKARFWNTWAS